MNNLPAILSAIVAFAATLSAGLFIKKFKSNIGIVCAFSAGFFIALALFDLIPRIYSTVPQAQISIEKPFLFGVAGFLVLLAFDAVFSKLHMKNHNMKEMSLQPRIGLFSTMEFCSHGFIEGLAIGVSFQLQFGLGVVVAIAVVSHDFCDGISTLALMLNSGNSLKSSLIMLLVAATAPVLGTAATLFFSLRTDFLVLMLSFLAGSFLYIGAGKLLPEANRMNRPSVTIIFFSLGFFPFLLFSTMTI